MSRVHLLVDDDENRRLLADWLSTDHEVVQADPEEVLDETIDLCIVDTPSLRKRGEVLVDEKRAIRPVHLPVLLVVTERNLEEPEGLDRIDEVADGGIDEVITAPVRKAELERRIRSLLHTRELSVELRDRNRELETVNRINSVIRDINQLLVEATTREEIERAVCDRLAGSDSYRFAEMGKPDATKDELMTYTTAGDCHERFGDLTVSAEDGDAEVGPADAVMRTREVRIARSDPEESGRFSAAGIPVAYEDTMYGVLVVCTDRATAFGEKERAVLRELGSTIGHAISAAENKRNSATDSVEELTFRIRDRDVFLCATSADEGWTFALEGVVSNADGGFLEFYDVIGAPTGRVIERADDSPAVEDADLVTRHEEERGLFEFTFADSSLVATFVDRGATVSRMTVEGGEAEVIARLPSAADVRAITGGIVERYADAQLVAQRESGEPVETERLFRTELDEKLTDRQKTVLRTAYLSGFFEWPRESTGEEVAESLDISSSTLHQHLRASERKLLDSFLD